MDLLSKDEPLINLNGFDSPEDLLSDESLQPHAQRRINPSKHASSSSSRQPRLSSGSKVYLRELSPMRKEQSMERHNSVIVAAVERTMKNYADGVLRVLEGMSGRLSQLELASQDLEHAVAALKGSVDAYHEHTDKNFKMLSERVMEMHRGLQILRDKQDIFEAHEQLAKLQTSKALAVKENIEEPSAKKSADFTDTEQGHQKQELALQVQHPPLAVPQPHVSPPQHVVTQQYQVPSLQSQNLGPAQHSSQEAPVHVLQYTPSAHTLSEQAQYQALPQQMQVQPSQQQPTNLPVQQPPEQVRYLPAPPQVHMPQPLLQQGPGQQPLQVTAQLSAPTQQQPEPTQYQSALPLQRQVQQPPSHQASIQQPIQAQQGMQTQQPSHMQSHSSSHLPGSFQYYSQPSESPGYGSLPQAATPTFVQGGYATDTARDPSNYAPHSRPLSSIPSHQLPQLAPMQTYPPIPPQVNQAPHDPNMAANVGGPMTWNRQTNPGTPGAVAPRLQTAQLVRSDHPPPSDVNGVVEKVAAMGFSRDQVHGVIRRLAERNQSVDMNVVLDILMNGGGGSQGGFGR